MIRDLGLDQAPVDPTTLTGDQLVKEVQRVVKALLGYGARMPKELMLYVKNLVFLDGAIARLAPDLDILAEIANISMLLRPAPRRAARPRARHRPTRSSVDLDGVKAGFGLDPSVERLTHRELQARRALIQQRMRDRPPGRRRVHRRRHGSVDGGAVLDRAARDRPVLRRLRRAAVGPPPGGACG